jgi:hypothetical protein
MMLAMFKKRKKQPKAERKAELERTPKPPPSSPPNALPTSPNTLPALSNASSNALLNTASTNANDDEISKFAKQSGIPENIVRIEFQIIRSLHNSSHKDIIERYYTLPVPALMPILKLRYIRIFWKQLNQNKHETDGHHKRTQKS